MLPLLFAGLGLMAWAAVPQPAHALSADKPVAADSSPVWQVSLQPWLASITAANPGVRARRHEAESLGRYAEAADALPDPMISIGAQSIPTDFDLAGEMMTQLPVVSLRQVIPYPGKLFSRRELGQARARVAEVRTQAMAEARALELSVAAFRMARLREEMEAVSTTLSWMRLLSRSADTQYRVGRGLGQDADQIRVELGRLEAESSRLRAALAEARADWLRILGEAAPETLAFEDEPWTPPADFVTTVTKNNPGVAVARALVRVAERRLDLEKSDYGPEFNIELGYGARPEGRTDFLSARVGFTVPLWAPWSQQPEVDGARLEQKSAEVGVEDAALEASAMFSRVVAEHEEALTRRNLYRRQVLPNAARARESSQGAYDAGAADIFVPIEAIRRELVLKREYAAIEAERRSAEARMLALAGRLSAYRPAETVLEEEAR